MKVFIYSMEKKSKDGRKFRSYWAYMNLKVSGQEDKGKVAKSVRVAFHQGVDSSKITRGILEGDFDLPDKYAIKKDKDGKDKYPTIWVNSITSFKEVPYKRNQNADDLIVEERSGEDAPSDDSGEGDEAKDELPF